MDTPADTLLENILSQPTAPFREGYVISQILSELKKTEIPHFLDRIGNIVIGAKSPAEYLRLVRQKSKEPLRVFIAHMDHPGFHGVRWKSDQELEVKWHGGSPTQHLENARVWLAGQSGLMQGGVVAGQMKNVKLHPSGRAIDTATVVISDPLPIHPLEGPTSLFGGFRFRAPVWREDALIYTKAADDLVGCFAVISVAQELWRKRKSKEAPPFLGLLTRAEEVGFIGAIGHFELGWLRNAKRPILCISLETSRTLAGADIGKGPVVRLGDRFTVFNPEALSILTELAAKTLPNQHQRRIMDGGTCEATAATAYGFTSIGISVPLGNYHNQSFQGGPDAGPDNVSSSFMAVDKHRMGPVAPLRFGFPAQQDPFECFPENGPAPEFVHRQDIEGLVTLCHAILTPKLPWDIPWNRKLKEFKSSLKTYRPLLRAGKVAR